MNPEYIKTMKSFKIVCILKIILSERFIVFFPSMQQMQIL